MVERWYLCNPKSIINLHNDLSRKKFQVANLQYKTIVIDEYSEVQRISRVWPAARLGGWPGRTRDGVKALCMDTVSWPLLSHTSCCCCGGGGSGVLAWRCIGSEFDWWLTETDNSLLRVCISMKTISHSSPIRSSWCTLSVLFYLSHAKTVKFIIIRFLHRNLFHHRLFGTSWMFLMNFYDFFNCLITVVSYGKQLKFNCTS